MHKLGTALGLALFATVTLCTQAQQTQLSDPKLFDPKLSDPISLSPQSRIVGGLPISITQAPATAALLNRARLELDGDVFESQFCGATVIASDWVVTAAHCVLTVRGATFDPYSIMVLTGSDNLENPTYQPIAVQQIIIHPDYQSVEQGSDIALLQLAVDTQAAPAAIDTQPVISSDPGYIAGWGAVNASDDVPVQTFSRTLRGTFVDMTEGSACGSLFPEYARYANETLICAGAVDGGRDSCQGDSGGPLYRIDSASNRVLALTGITSWGISCGVAEFPGIYTGVSTYVDWIQGNLRGNGARITTNTGDAGTSTAAILPANDDALAVSSGGAPLVDTPPINSSSSESADTIFSGSIGSALLAFAALMLVVRRRRVTLFSD